MRVIVTAKEFGLFANQNAALAALMKKEFGIDLKAEGISMQALADKLTAKTKSTWADAWVDQDTECLVIYISEDALRISGAMMLENAEAIFAIGKAFYAVFGMIKPMLKGIVARADGIRQRYVLK